MSEAKAPDRSLEERSRPSWLPEIRQYAQKDFNTVQRPEGLDGPGDEGVEARDIVRDEVRRYASVQVTPGQVEELVVYPAAAVGSALGPAYNQSGEVVLIDKQTGFPAASIYVDNWTNQWLYFVDLRRFVPPYSGGWVYNTFKQTQKMKVMLRAPSASYAPAAAIAGEYVWFGFAEAWIPPQTGVITTVKTPVTA